jgi:uncharacterized protein with HEPN domain
MSRHDDAVSLAQMRDHAREALDMAAGRSHVDLQSDRQFQLALTRLVEIVGEAAGRVSERSRAQHKTIPWREIVGMRHRLIHGYDRVDLDILWEVVRKDLRDLVTQLDAILGP